ncbi:unnamed protein product [Arabidopsis arenosa]|uniref:Uncharacterized protein n=1 Tax=Arabidopsis arenosa TaxID=38785 RepID=A0A8S1ZKL5_ARAAE|nr:unnamed protein product [Arabidopsis arenosa]
MKRHSCCYKQKLRKGLWSPEEDEKLLNYITKNGHGCWSSVPKLAGKTLSSPKKAWSQIAARLPGRTDNEIKNLWNSCIKKKLMKKGIDPITHRPLSEVNKETNKSNNHNSTSFSSETNQDFFVKQTSDFSKYSAFQKQEPNSVSLDNSLSSTIPTQFNINIDGSVSNPGFETQVCVKPSITLLPPPDNTSSNVDHVKVTEPNWETNCGTTSHLNNPCMEEIKWSDECLNDSLFSSSVYVKSETDFNSNIVFPWSQSQACDVFPKDLQRMAFSFAADNNLTLISATKEVVYVYALENILSDPKWVLLKQIRNGILNEKRLYSWGLEAYDGKCLVLKETILKKDDYKQVLRGYDLRANKWEVIGSIPRWCTYAVDFYQFKPSSCSVIGLDDKEGELRDIGL